MGCGSSSVKMEDAEHNELPGYDKAVFEDPESPLTLHEVSSRIVCCQEPKIVSIGPKLTLEYAFLSQRGYYPDDLHKANQDSFVAIPKYMDKKNRAFFGVFDGHGATGDKCAIFARDKIQACFAENLNAGDGLADACLHAYVKTNSMLHDSHIDDRMSGTTAITVLFDDQSVYVANAGDSRAIIARAEDGKVKAIPLSVDQTPYRFDERQRVKKCGARVMTLDQLEGLAPMHENWGLNLGEEVDEDGDPPRIWSKLGNFPGTAFTRSIGDEKAEHLGVFAEPETLAFDITPEDQFIVLASDGVFEFLTSQAVVEIVQRFSNPVLACRAVVSEAYKLWLHYEVRTDDITMICIFLRNSAPMPRVPSKSRLTGIPDAQIRPVRKNMSKAKKRAQMAKDMSLVVTKDDMAYEIADHIVPKTSEERKEIESIMQKNFVFQHLSANERDNLMKIMVKVNTKKGDVIIRQGDVGDQFYCVEKGSYSVMVKSADKNGKSTEDVVHQYDGSTNPSFGELALMHGNRRSSSVVTINDGVLWSIDCRAFRKLVMKGPSPILSETLRKVDILCSLDIRQIDRLSATLTESVFEDGEAIITEGDIGTNFFVIREGNVVCTKKDDEELSGQREVLRLGEYEYFGERALLNDEPRAATVKAIGKTHVLQIGRVAFEELLGPLEGIINEDRKRREAKHKFDLLVQNANKRKFDRQSTVPNNSNVLSFVTAVSQSTTGYLSLYTNALGEYYSVKVTVKTVAEKLEKATVIIREAKLLNSIHQNFVASQSIPTPVLKWKDNNALYMATSRCMVQDLSSLVAESNGFSEEIAKFYAAQTLLALEALHDKGYVYRNLDADELYVDSKGYLLLPNYQFCKLVSKNKTFTLCGTPTYMAPEMISAQGHNYSVDIWAMGILLYEMLMNKTPFEVDIQHEHGEKWTEEAEMAIFAQISRFEKSSFQFSKNLSDSCKDLLEKLLHPSAELRLGCQGQIDVEKGGSTIRSHPWFSNIDWVGIAAGNVISPQSELLKHRLDAYSSGEIAKLPMDIPVYEPSGDIDFFADF